VTSGRKAPTGPPASAGVLAKYVQAYARANGIAEGRVRAWISHMIAAGVLRRVAGNQPPFIVKGGVALELRLRNRARATQDIDLIPLMAQDHINGIVMNTIGLAEPIRAALALVREHILLADTNGIAAAR
jgi:hypothetical protein